MEYEYRIEVCMTPHPWDNKNKPYYWVIFEGNCNAGFGWSETPEKAWEDANEYHKKYHIMRKEDARRKAAKLLDEIHWFEQCDKNDGDKCEHGRCVKAILTLGGEKPGFFCGKASK